MEKKTIPGENLKERLQAAAKDRLHRFFLSDGHVRGALVHGTRLVMEMRANHELGLLETLILGHAYMGGLLMASSLKGKDRVALRSTAPDRWAVWWLKPTPTERSGVTCETFRFRWKNHWRTLIFRRFSGPGLSV